MENVPTESGTGWCQEIERGEGAGRLTEIFVTQPLKEGESLRMTLDAALGRAGSCVPAKIHCFYPAALRAEALELSGRCDLPLMMTESDGGDSLGGIFLHGVRGENCKPLRWKGRPVGLLFGLNGVDYCYLCDIRGENGSEAEQTQQVLDAMDSLLQEAGMSFRNVLRTWFYNRDILAWYPDFNRVRTAYFQKHAIFENLLPASTGIGADNPYDAALVAAVFAVRDPSGETQGREVPSPLQCPATDYGSSFSRAVRFDTADHCRLTLSGTASINREGDTVCVGDFEKQYHFTHEVIGEILAAEGFAWENVVRGIAYFRHPEDAVKAMELPSPGNFPVIRTVNVVCRDNLLYELEVNAVKKK